MILVTEHRVDGGGVYFQVIGDNMKNYSSIARKDKSVFISVNFRGSKCWVPACHHHGVDEDYLNISYVINPYEGFGGAFVTCIQKTTKPAFYNKHGLDKLSTKTFQPGNRSICPKNGLPQSHF